jgi:hypothetical protein
MDIQNPRQSEKNHRPASLRKGDRGSAVIIEDLRQSYDTQHLPL